MQSLTSLKKVLIVGAGMVAHFHASPYARGPLKDTARICGVVEVDEGRGRRFAEEHNIPRQYKSVQEALTAEEPDVVHICSPPALHKEQAIESLETGAWVICEKPPCASLAEWDEIQDAAEVNDGEFFAVFQWRYGSGLRHLRHLLDDGALGRPLVAVCNTLWFRDDDYYSVPWRGTWDSELGGPTVGLGIHLMDALLLLLGDWSEVTAQMATLGRAIEMEDVSVATIRFKSGALATVTTSALSPRQETYLRLDCEAGTVEATGLYQLSNDDWRWTPLEAPHAGRGNFTGWTGIPDVTDASQESLIVEAFGVMEGRMASSYQAGLTRSTLELITALYKSAAEKRVIEAGAIRPGDPYYHSLSGHPRRAQAGRVPRTQDR